MEENLKGGQRLKKKIIYIYPQASTFVNKDIQFLSDKYEVITPKHNWNKKELILFRFLQQFLFLLKYIRGSEAVLVMFGGYWSFLPALLGKLFRRPVFIILGGTDCVSFPEINYGSLRKPILRAFIKQSYILCSRLLPVSESLVETDYSYLNKCKYPKQGYTFFFPSIKTPYTVVHNGYDPLYWKSHNLDKIPESFITVASITDNKRFELKGIDLIIKLAQQFKKCTFTIVGISETFQKQLEEIPENVRMISFVNPVQLKEYLFSSQYYLQLSISEGFPNALSEGMLSECIPIGSNVGAIPEIIGDTGFIVEKRDIELIQNKISAILSIEEEEKRKLAKAARERIITQFNIEKRKDAFFEIIESAI